MSALNSNNTFDGLDEPVRPTPGVEKQTGQRKSQKTTKKKSSQVKLSFIVIPLHVWTRDVHFKQK